MGVKGLLNAEQQKKMNPFLGLLVGNALAVMLFLALPAVGALFDHGIYHAFQTFLAWGTLSFLGGILGIILGTLTGIKIKNKIEWIIAWGVGGAVCAFSVFLLIFSTVFGTNSSFNPSLKFMCVTCAVGFGVLAHRHSGKKDLVDISLGFFLSVIWLWMLAYVSNIN